MLRTLPFGSSWLFVLACLPVLACSADDSSNDGSGQAITSKGDGADYAGAKFVGSPNFAAGRSANGTNTAIDCIVIHTTEMDDNQSVISKFQDQSAQASAHYLVEGDGTIVQFVHDRDVAWHTGNKLFNRRCIGIEHQGFADKPDFPQEQLSASARLVAALITKYSVPFDRDHVIGHYQVPSDASQTDACSTDTTTCGGSHHHYDPGRGGGNWPWASYLSDVSGLVGLGSWGDGPTGAGATACGRSGSACVVDEATCLQSSGTVDTSDTTSTCATSNAPNGVCCAVPAGASLAPRACGSGGSVCAKDEDTCTGASGTVDTSDTGTCATKDMPSGVCCTGYNSE